MGKKYVLIASLALNVLLLAMCVYLLSSTSSKKEDTYKVDRDVFFAPAFSNDDVLFLGGERMQLCSWRVLYGDKRYFNYSVGEYSMKEEMTRLELLFENAQPSEVVLMLGMTDLRLGRPVNEVCRDVAAYVDRLRELTPQSEVLLVSPLPVTQALQNAYSHVTYKDISTYNLLLKMMAQEKGLAYLNLMDEFTNREEGLKGEFDSGDGFHLNTHAYHIWKEMMRSYLH